LPGGAIDWEKGGGRRGDRGDFIGAARCQIWQEMKRIKQREIIGGGLGHRRDFRLEDSDDKWGPLSAREREREGWYLFGFALLGHGPIRTLGRLVLGALLPIFLFCHFLFFCFSDLFTTILFELKIRSKQILKFSKIQHSILEQ
jgi:hypothetical protein